MDREILHVDMNSFSISVIASGLRKSDANFANILFQLYPMLTVHPNSDLTLSLTSSSEDKLTT